MQNANVIVANIILQVMKVLHSEFENKGITIKWCHCSSSLILKFYKQQEENLICAEAKMKVLSDQTLTLNLFHFIFNLLSLSIWEQ